MPDSVNRVILSSGDIVFVSEVMRDEDGVPKAVKTPSGTWYTDGQIAYYLETDDEITVGVLLEALGPDWVVF